MASFKPADDDPTRRGPPAHATYPQAIIWIVGPVDGDSVAVSERRARTLEDLEKAVRDAVVEREQRALNFIVWPDPYGERTWDREDLQPVRELIEHIKRGHEGMEVLADWLYSTGTPF
jgi:hypothetical protein